VFQILHLIVTYFSVDKKNQPYVTFCILYFSSNSCSTCFGQPCAHQELTTAWCYSLVLACAWLQEGCQVWLAGSASTCQLDLTTFPQPRHIPTRGYNITQSSALDDGHMVARNMLSNYYKRSKEYKKWHLVGFSYPRWIMMHGQPHISVTYFIIIAFTFRDMLQWIVRRPRGWPVSVLHYSAIVQIMLNSQALYFINWAWLLLYLIEWNCSVIQCVLCFQKIILY
jgi:hypothetical protein